MYSSRTIPQSSFVPNNDRLTEATPPSPMIKTMSSPPNHPPNPPPHNNNTFHLFPNLPFELRDQIFLVAAGHPPSNPQIHFFLINPPSFPPQDAQIYSLEDETPLSLTPHPTSGAHNTISLSLACRAAQDAVRRAQQALRKYGHGTVLGCETSPSMGLVLDLSVDLVCFLGGERGEGDVLCDVVGRGEGSHLLFGAVRRFAVRYVPGWERRRGAGGVLAHGVGCPAGWGVDVRERDEGAVDGFCSRCVARFVERFQWLEEFWLIVAEKNLGGQVDRERGEKPEFHSYGRRYFSPDMSMAGAGAKDASEALERIRLNMVS